MNGPNEIVLIATLALASLLPFIIAAGSCFIKFSIVFSLVRNAIGLQEVPSNITLHGIALIMTFFVMTPVFNQIQEYTAENPVSLKDPASVKKLINEGLGNYQRYLKLHSDPALVDFFVGLRQKQESANGEKENIPSASFDESDEPSVLTLLPAYALSEIKSAFKIGFYVYLPFIVIDLLVSNILLALGMMMMSPVTISLPIKLVMFVAIDGWSKLSQGLIMQYIDMWKS